MYRSMIAAALCVALHLPTAGQASETPQPVQQHNSNALWFENWTGLSNASMTISYPDGTLETIEARSGTPVFKLTGSKVLDGIYRYELNAATDKTEKIKNPINNGRGDAARSERAVPFYANGYFTVSRGVIVTPEDLKEE